MNEYRQEWEKYRKVVLVFLLVWLGFIPFGLFAAFLSNRIFHTDTLAFWLAGAWIVFWLASYFRICAWKCPRCGEYFIGRWWNGNVPLFRKCAHCGLPKPRGVLLGFRWKN